MSTTFLPPYTTTIEVLKPCASNENRLYHQAPSTTPLTIDSYLPSKYTEVKDIDDEQTNELLRNAGIPIKPLTVEEKMNKQLISLIAPTDKLKYDGSVVVPDYSKSATFYQYGGMKYNRLKMLYLLLKNKLSQ